ncbi:MAG: hypothetical protein NTV42_00960 [Chloroflexi bacterium]|nr:hypothetical protein [Chloroflexota bacterium]
MTVAYTPKDAVLDVVAIALILAPEPLTTPIGISLLLRKRGDGANEMAHPIRVYPEYVYKVDTIRGREITWEVRTIQTGQLPLGELNRPNIEFKPREEFIRSRTAPEKSAAQKIRENLPPGVRVHHEIFRPPRAPASQQSAVIPGETIYHTLRQAPQLNTLNNKAPAPGNIHHTIENSPGYYRATAAGPARSAPPDIIHHTLKEAPRSDNPANIVKPVRIVQHHTVDPTPPIQFKGRIIRKDPGTPENRGGIIGRNGDRSRR